MQLYKTRKYTKPKSNKCYLFDWWASKKLTKYPSSLHINLKRVKPENQKYHEKDSKLKSEKLLNLNADISERKLPIDENDRMKEEDISVEKTDKGSEKRIWSRISTQSCKLPNKVLYKLKTGDKGCIKLKFSNNGLFLAYGSASETNFLIFILNVRLYLICFHNMV